MKLGELIKDLPEKIQAQITCNAALSHNPAKQLMLAAAAKYLVNRGLKEIALWKTVLAYGGSKFHVDIYCMERNMYVTCLEQSAPWANDRAYMIRKADQQAIVVMVVKDWFAFSADDLKTVADEVWVVDREGAVLKLEEWREQRHKYLTNTTLEFAREIRGLCKHLEIVKNEYINARNSELDLYNYITSQLIQLGKAVKLNELNWLTNRKYITGKSELLTCLNLEMKLTRNEILRITIDFANKLLTKYKPYMLNVTESGEIFVYADPDAWQWICVNLYSDPAAEKSLQKEIEIVRESIEEAEKSGKILPKNFDVFYFVSKAGHMPPQVITVPRAALEEIYEQMKATGELLKTLRV
ncbi:MAG: hypothetical protein QXZ70_03430 [Candidatus Bathyarchaeia archaeon]